MQALLDVGFGLLIWYGYYDTYKRLGNLLVNDFFYIDSADLEI